MEWRFGKLEDSQTRENPNQEEFFSQKEDAFRDFSVSLIREDIQNRLDAKPMDASSDERVRVRYYLSTSGADSKGKISRWFDGLKEHCNSNHCLRDLFGTERTCFDQPFRFLTIECFGTTGLVGDPSQFNEGKYDLKANDFYWMFRNVGRSGKAKLRGKRGSWGIGKVVYHMASEAMTFLCYSVTKERFTLMGKAHLVPHWIGDQGYHTDGFLAEYGNGNVPMPVVDISCETARRFKADFGITRKDHECGTSTVVPFCVKDITMAQLAMSAIRSYLWEILNGRVRIEIAADSGEKDVVLEAGSVKDDIVRFFIGSSEDAKAEREKYLAFVDFYEEIIKSRRGQLKLPEFELKVPQSLTAVSANIRSVFPSQVEFENAKKAYADGKIVGVKANVVVNCNATRDEPASKRNAVFRVYLQSGEMTAPQVALIRDGLTILELPRHRDSVLRALTLVEPEGGNVNALSDFIRAAESPAHSDLSSDRKQFHILYAHGSKSLLRYVCDLMYILAASFTDMAGTEDREALMDFFSIDMDDTAGEQKKKRKRKRGSKRTVPDHPPKPIPHTPSIFKIWDRWPQGVKITTANEPEDLPRRIQVTLAYSVEGDADPVKRYDLADFDCRSKGTVSINATGCSAVKRDPNRVTFDITERQFAIEMTGFDPKRDVHVDVKEIKRKAEGEEEEVEA